MSSRVLKSGEEHVNPVTAFSYGEFAAQVVTPFSGASAAAGFQRDEAALDSVDSDFRLGEGFGYAVNKAEEERKLRSQGEIFLDEVMDKAVNIEKEAYRKGLEAGREIGRREAHDEIAQSTGAFANAVETLLGEKEAIWEQNRKAILDLAFIVAKKVLAYEIETNPDSVAHVIKETISRVGESDAITIKINPEDMEIAGKYKDDFKAVLGTIMAITLESDSSISRGGCVIETNLGDIDARIESQTEQIEAGLRKSEGY